MPSFLCLMTKRFWCSSFQLYSLWTGSLLGSRAKKRNQQADQAECGLGWAAWTKSGLGEEKLAQAMLGSLRMPKFFLIFWYLLPYTPMGKLFTGYQLYKSDDRVSTDWFSDQIRYISMILIWQLFPYHLSDVIVKGLRITPFSYYCSIMESIMSNERSYDSLPNFTAADCEFWDLRKWVLCWLRYTRQVNYIVFSKMFSFWCIPYSQVQG